MSDPTFRVSDGQGGSSAVAFVRILKSSEDGGQLNFRLIDASIGRRFVVNSCC